MKTLVTFGYFIAGSAFLYLVWQSFGLMSTRSSFENYSGLIILVLSILGIITLIKK